MGRWMTRWGAILFVLGLMLFVTGIAHAETKTVENVTGVTWLSADVYKGVTTATASKYYLEVNIRAWGIHEDGYWEIKDQQTKFCYNCTNSGAGQVWNGYSYAATRHRYKPHSTATISFWTSGTGCQSSSCWWGSPSMGCSSTC